MARARLFMLVLWAGSLWTIGLIVAPMLFATLDDPAQAGRLAARFFAIETWMSLVMAALMWLAGANKRQRWLSLAIAATLGVMHFGVAPWMGQVSFGHSLAAGLYFVGCILAAVMVFTFPSPAE